MRHLDPVTLRLFVAVCEEGSIFKGAEREAIVPSAITKRLNVLEDMVGVKLLTRARKGVKITPAGETLLRYARTMLSEMYKTLAELSEYAEGVQGHVRIYASMSSIVEFLPDDVQQFLKEYQYVRVSLEEKVSSEIARGVEDGSADIGICWDAGSLNGLHTIPYHKDQLAVVVHPAHPLSKCTSISFEEILEFEHIEIQAGSIVQLTQQRKAANLGKSIRYRLQVGTFDAACRLVSSNLGIAVVPIEVVSVLENALEIKCIPLTDEWTKRSFVICMRSYETLNVPARLLVDNLLQSAGGRTSSL